MKRAMVFIDFDNLVINLRRSGVRLDFDVLINTIKSKVDKEHKDKCLVWGNCYRNYDPRFKSGVTSVTNKTGVSMGNLPESPKHLGMYAAHERGIVPVYAPAYQSNYANSGESSYCDGTALPTPKFKSLCDPMLICDAMEALYENRNIDFFVLVSSDKDFIPLIRKIAEKGKEACVIGLGMDAFYLIKECERLGFDFLDYLQLENQFKMTDVVQVITESMVTIRGI